MNAKEVKEYRKKHNLTQKQLAEITKSSLRAVQYWESQGRKVPGSAIELMSLYAHYPHNEATYNTINNNGGDNIYINNNGGSISNSGNTTGGQEAPGQHNGQGQEIKEMTKLLNQLHETKIIEIDRITKLYNEIISNQNELISQYRKEIESLRQRIKENTENNKE